MRFILLGLLIAGCSTSNPPTSTKALCPTPDPMTLTWDNFGQGFMTEFCTDCHSSTLLHSQRNGAPLYHDYDTLMGVLEIPDHIDQWSGSGPAATNTLMPPSQCPSMPGGPLNRACPQPTEQQRKDLSVWLACEVKRVQTQM
ncbi:MAG TPA: hypothetical protein VHW23_34090 [Kofleriaceae bacterium]|jgi:hypothetical protein|nr:hypothetical protein [Kofleriaceae bacterium]